MAGADAATRCAVPFLQQAGGENCGKPRYPLKLMAVFYSPCIICPFFGVFSMRRQRRASFWMQKGCRRTFEMLHVFVLGPARFQGSMYSCEIATYSLRGGLIETG